MGHVRGTRPMSSRNERDETQNVLTAGLNADHGFMCAGAVLVILL